MLNIKEYILEKYKISKNTTIQYSHEEFKSKDDSFKYIISLCKQYNFKYLKQGYWIYVYKKEDNDYPNVLFAYCKETSSHEQVNILNSVVAESGRYSKGNIIINTGPGKYKEIPYPDDLDMEPLNKKEPSPTEHNIITIFNILDNFTEDEKH